MAKPELEKILFSHLMKVEFSTLDEMIKLFQCTRENLINIIKSNTKTKTSPLGFILENKQITPYQYSIEPTNYETVHIQISNYLKGINGILRLSYQSLSVQNIFKSDSHNTVNFTDKGREVLDNISLILDRIQQLSFLVTFYKLNNKIPKNMIIQADDDHEKCINMYLEIIKKLKNVENTNKSSQQAIESYLFKHQFVVNHLNSSI
ncbi:hypothetical protein OAQ30_04205 [Nitrosopumilus sp.]|nr:hypothetical protein [Nitrosopumilus sp.]